MGPSPTLSQVNIQAPCLSFVSPWRQMSHPTGEPSKLHLCCCGSHFFMPFTATLHLFNYYSSGVALLTSLAVGFLFHSAPSGSSDTCLARSVLPKPGCHLSIIIEVSKASAHVQKNTSSLKEEG